MDQKTLERFLDGALSKFTLVLVNGREYEVEVKFVETLDNSFNFISEDAMSHTVPYAAVAEIIC